VKFTRILTTPLALIADIATLGNMGDRSFTQQLFDAERREQEQRAVIELLRALTQDDRK